MGSLEYRSLVFVPLALLLVTSACTKAPEQQIKLDTEYKAFFLANGQVFFGRLEESGPAYVLVSDVFYVQSQVVQQDKDKREVRNILIKRGNEWHGPDRMYINTSQLAVIEPVNANSKVAQLIKDAKAQKPGGGN